MDAKTFVIIHIITIKMSSSKPILNIITHGNCADGLGAAYLFWKAYSFDHDVRVYPVAPAFDGTWPSVESVRGHMLVFLDVTCGSRMAEYAAAASEMKIIDHHPSAEAHRSLATAATIATDCCATRLAWSILHPGLPEPFWVTYVNQIDLWQDVNEQTLAFREMVTPIARTAVSHSPLIALEEMDRLVRRMEDPEQECAVYFEGTELYKDKMIALETLLTTCPQFYGLIDAELQAKWSLPDSWLGKTLFVANTSKDFIGSAVFDTTAMSQRVFELHPDATIFINYHKVTWSYRGKPHCKYVYHARARGDVDLTNSDVLDGHALAAGGQYQPPKTDGVCPFVL
jgi:hypothetical protein